MAHACRIEEHAARPTIDVEFLHQCAHGAHALPVAPQGQLAAACHDASAYGIRYAMLAVSVVLIWSSVHYFLASRHIRRGN